MDSGTYFALSNEDLDIEERSDEFRHCSRCFPKSEFDRYCARIARRCPDIRGIIRDDSATMYKQMIAWVIRCGLTGAGWTAGYTAGALLDGATPSTAVTSPTAWVGAGIGQGVAEMACVFFIGHYLSNPDVVFESNSNGAGLRGNLWEGVLWALACIPGGTAWQALFNQFCTSPKDLSRLLPICTVKVGASTGAIFGGTLACIKALQTIVAPNHFRPFNASNTFADSVLFALFICVWADILFGQTGKEGPFNYEPYSTAEQFEVGPVFTQACLSGMSTIIGGLIAYGIRGTLRGAVGLADAVQEGDVSGAARNYRRNFSLNSQCALL